MSKDTQVEKQIAALDTVLEAAQIHLSNLNTEMPPDSSPAQAPVKAVANILSRSITVVEDLILETKTAATADQGAVNLAIQVLKDHGYTVTAMDHTDKGEMVRPFLDLSNSHITEEDAIYLDQAAAGTIDCALTVDVKNDAPYSFWLYAEYEDGYAFKNAPKAIQAVMQFARDKNCDWICLHADASRIPTLPHYNW